MRESLQPTMWEIAARLDSGDVAIATHYLLGLHPADQADLLAELSPEERQLLLSHLDPERIAAVLEHLTPPEIDQVTGQLPVGQLAAALDESPADVAADVLHTLEDESAAAVLNAMDEADSVEPLLEHTDESAGGIMTPDLVTLAATMSADDAITYLRRVQPRAGDVYYLYVVDSDNALQGVISLRDLIVAQPQQLLRDLMNPNVISTTPETDQEEVLRTLQHYNLRAVPVVIAEGRLVGAATADDLLDVAQQEATEDMFRMVGLDEEEHLNARVRTSVRRRLPWLTLNLATAFMAAGTVSVFEDTLTRAAVLAIYMPIIAGQSGNAGIQTLTLVVRSMALGDVERRAWRRLLPREAAICLVNGLAIGLVRGARQLALARQRLAGARGGHRRGGQHAGGQPGGRLEPRGHAPAPRRPRARQRDLRDHRDGRHGVLYVPGLGVTSDRQDRLIIDPRSGPGRLRGCGAAERVCAQSAPPPPRPLLAQSATLPGTMRHRRP